MKKNIYRKRFLRVLTTFLKVFLAFRKEFKLIRDKGYRAAQKKMEKIHRARARELYKLAVESGGVMIKLCQYFSTRRDMFPEPYIEILSPLQDQVPPVSFEEIESRLVNEYGDYHKYFASIEREPLAAASLGQVHRAVLKNGASVVIKVLKPEAEKAIDADFSILYHVFKLFSRFKSVADKMDLITMLNEFIKVTGDELNFRREVYMSKLLRVKLAKFDYLKIPYVYEEYSTEKIIVMEFCEGCKITEIEDFDELQCDPMILARRIVEIYIEQLLFIKVVHFDPHPGNILVLPNNQITLLDFGMSGEITDKMSNGIKEGIKGFIGRDYRKIIDVLYTLGFFKKGVNRYQLLPVLEYLFDEVVTTVRLDKESLQTVDLSPVLDDLIDIIYAQPLNLPVEWAYIARAVSTLAGIVASLNPGFKLYEEFKPYTDKLLRDNVWTIAGSTFHEAVQNVRTMVSLPGRLKYLLDNQDTGLLKFKVDLSEVDDRLDELKNTIVKLVGFGIGFFCMIGAYTLYYVGTSESYIYLGALGFVSFLFAFFYSQKSKNQKKRDFIKKNINL